MSASPNPPPAVAARPSLLRRIALAIAVIGDADFAARIETVRRGPPPSSQAPPAAPRPAQGAPVLKESTSDAALQLLTLLQREARLVDFVGEDIAAYTDTQVGVAARLVHAGCAKVLREHFSIVPVRSEDEGSRVTLSAGFDAAAVRLTGNVVGQPPFAGSLSHRGWRVAEVRLPLLADRHDARIIAPAEVEL